MVWINEKIPESWKELHLDSLSEMLRCRPVRCGKGIAREKRALFEAWEAFRQGLVDAAGRGLPAKLKAEGTIGREEWAQDACRLMTDILVVCVALCQGVKEKPIESIDLQKLDKKFHLNGLLNEYSPEGLEGQMGQPGVMKRLCEIANALSTYRVSDRDGKKRDVTVIQNFYNGESARVLELDKVVKEFPADLVDPAGCGEELKQLLKKYLTKGEPLMPVWRAMTEASDDEQLRDCLLERALERIGEQYFEAMDVGNARRRSTIEDRYCDASQDVLRSIKAVNDLISWGGKTVGLDRRHYINWELLLGFWWGEGYRSYGACKVALWEGCIEPHLQRCMHGKETKEEDRFLQLCKDAFALPTQWDLQCEENAYIYYQGLDIAVHLPTQEVFSGLSKWELPGLAATAWAWNDYVRENGKEYGLTRISYLTVDDFDDMPQCFASDLTLIKEWLWCTHIRDRILAEMGVDYDALFDDDGEEDDDEWLDDDDDEYYEEKEFMKECETAFFLPSYVEMFPKMLEDEKKNQEKADGADK